MLINRMFTQQGSTRKDNRDCVTHFRIGRFTIFLIMDGATSTPKSGLFVQEICSRLSSDISHYPVYQSLNQLNQRLEESLKNIQRQLQRPYIEDFASLLLISCAGYQANILYWGDCLFGKIQPNKNIEWLTQPHLSLTALAPMPLAEIVMHQERDQLSRSFRARRYCRPDSIRLALEPDQDYILASDGFWSAHVNIQKQLLVNGALNPSERPSDDYSFITFTSL